MREKSEACIKLSCRYKPVDKDGFPYLTQITHAQQPDQPEAPTQRLAHVICLWWISPARCGFLRHSCVEDTHIHLSLTLDSSEGRYEFPLI